LVFLLVTGIILSFGILTYLIDRKETSILLSYDRDRSALLANDIAREVRELMLVEKKPAVIRTLVTNHNVPGEIQTALFRGDGTLYAGETDHRVPLDMFSVPKETSFMAGERLIFFTPLLKEMACQQCHASDKTVLGVLMVDISTRKMLSVTRDLLKSMIFFTIVIAVLSSGLLIVILRRNVFKPISVLHAGAEKISSGDYHYRVSLPDKDEFGRLASTFNQMAERIETSHLTLERVVQQRTMELEVVAKLSTEVFRGDRNFIESIDLFLDTITDKLGFGYAFVCIVDRETSLLSLDFRKGSHSTFCPSDISLAGDHPLARAILEARPVVMNAEDLGAPKTDPQVAVIPIISHQRKHCREVNLCHHQAYPAYGSTEERCWLINDSLCRSLQAIQGKGKIFGCMHCSAFPIYGVLLAGAQSISDSTLHFLEILSAEISAAWENHLLLDEKKEDIANLIRLHDLSIQKMTTLDMPSLMNFIVTSIIPFAKMQAALLWLKKEDGLHFSGSFVAGCTSEEDYQTLLRTGIIPAVIPIDGSLIGRSITERRPAESVKMSEITFLDKFINENGFKYAISLPLIFREEVQGCITLFKTADFFMADAEKAAIALFTSQASAAMHTVRLYDDLRSSKDFSEAIFDSTASGIIIIDRKGHILKINSSGAQILGRSVKDMVGEEITSLHPEMSEFLSVEPAPGQEVSITTCDNRIIPIGFTSSLLPGSHDHNEGIIVLFRDLSEIKKLQEELRKKEYFVTMGKVVAGVAHEVRNPLFGISSIGQILERENDNPQHQALISAMLRECDRMKNLVDELLLYTRPARLDIREIDLGLLFMELEHHIKGKRDGIKISVEIPPSLTISADRDKITQVLLNVLNNALEAARTCVTVTATRAGDQTEIRIEDDGSGIPQKNREKIFEPFFTTKKGGTGLGLPICKKLIEDHQGSITIISPEAKGTEVVLQLKS
jgi:PAS domain S-box-containing protein